MGVAKNQRGRPGLLREKRAVRRVTLRVRPDDAALLAALCERLELRQSELARRAIRELAEEVLAKEGRTAIAGSPAGAHAMTKKKSKPLTTPRKNSVGALTPDKAERLDLNRHVDEAFDLVLARVLSAPLEQLGSRARVLREYGQSAREADADVQAARKGRALLVVKAAIESVLAPQERLDRWLSESTLALDSPVGIIEQRARVVQIVRDTRVEPEFAAEGVTLDQRVHAELGFVAREFSSLDFKKARSTLNKLSSKPGGAGRRGVPSVCAELGLAAGAFGDKPGPGETKAEALARVTKAYEKAERSHRSAVRRTRSKLTAENRTQS